MAVWLIGAGQMAQDYARVLQALDAPFRVIGRGLDSAQKFEKATGQTVETCGLATALDSGGAPTEAIVAVGVEQLALTATALIEAGTQHILLEKPGGLNEDEIARLEEKAIKRGAKVLIAYNRRFYNSVDQARKFIRDDGGLLSAQFDFTEWAHKIAPIVKAPGVKERWLLVNSSHVIDLAFYLCGRPKDWRCWHTGALDWHPASARFAGAGVTDKDVMFAYMSDWQAPGRWGLELMTAKRKIILRPVEQIQVTPLGSIGVEEIVSTDLLDQEFKPGLYRQTKAFLSRELSQFCTLSEQGQNVKIYSVMAGYKK